MKDTDKLLNLIGKNLKDIRKNNIRKSQKEIAEDTNLSRSFIAQIESQKMSKGISLDTLYTIAQTYNFDIRDFFGDYEKLMNK